jgi:ribosomal protein S18 acetylase RimI-like enzyme
MRAAFHIRLAESAADLEAAAQLFRAYAARGAAGEALGCVALRPLAEGGCEMKRLYIIPAARRLGLGKALVETILSEAARLGYGEMRLDTLHSMTEALALYGRFGFKPVAPYYDTPIKGTVFLARTLSTK